MTTGKTIALTRWTFVGKVMSLLFNMLSRLVLSFLPRSKRLLISWLQSPSAVILECKKIKPGTVSTVSPSISHEMMEPDAMILVLWMLSVKPNFSFSWALDVFKNVLQCWAYNKQSMSSIKKTKKLNGQRTWIGNSVFSFFLRKIIRKQIQLFY